MKQMIESQRVLNFKTFPSHASTKAESGPFGFVMFTLTAIAVVQLAILKYNI